VKCLIYRTTQGLDFEGKATPSLHGTLPTQNKRLAPNLHLGSPKYQNWGPQVEAMREHLQISYTETKA